MLYSTIQLVYKTISLDTSEFRHHTALTPAEVKIIGSKRNNAWEHKYKNNWIEMSKISGDEESASACMA